MPRRRTNYLSGFSPGDLSNLRRAPQNTRNAEPAAGDRSEGSVSQAMQNFSIDQRTDIAQATDGVESSLPRPNLGTTASEPGLDSGISVSWPNRTDEWQDDWEYVSGDQSEQSYGESQGRFLTCPFGQRNPSKYRNLRGCFDSYNSILSLRGVAVSYLAGLHILMLCLEIISRMYTQKDLSDNATAVVPTLGTGRS